jgi:hypothetical protein
VFAIIGSSVTTGVATSVTGESEVCGAGAAAVAIGMFGSRVYSAVTDVVVVASAAATISISCKIWPRLVHVKHIHDLCNLLDHILSNLIVL